MNRWYPFSLLITIFFAGCSSEKIDPTIEKHIRLWQANGADQCVVWYEVIADLIERQDSVLFTKEINALYDYIGNHPNKRIEAQILHYHVLGAKLLHLKQQPDANLLERALLLAKEINNERLVSEIYAVYATLYGHDGSYLYYSLKSLEIQEKYGLENFTYVQNRYFDISRMLYNAKEYEKSIYYGKESLRQVNISPRVFDTAIYVYLSDIIGNDYLQLNEPDSAEKYFVNGIHYAKKIFSDPVERNVWISVATGNLGQLDYLKGDYENAFKKVYHHYDTSLKYADYLNIAIAGNRLGDLYAAQKNFTAAEARYLTAMQSALTHKAYDQGSYAAGKLRDIHLQKKNFQKALEYEQLSTRLTREYQDYLDLVNLNRLQAIQQTERTQAALIQSKEALDKERTKKNNLIYLFVFVSVTIIIILFRMRMRNQHRLLMNSKEKEAMAMEKAFSEAQLQNFKKSIIEKNSLIDELTAKVNENQKVELNQSLLEQTLITESEWERFKIEFQKVYPQFSQVVREYLSQPTPAEQRLLSLMVLGLDHQQIGNALGISKESVGRSKRRLRLRLQTQSGIDIHELLSKISRA